MTSLTDVSAERFVLAGICQYGSSAYLDVADIIQDGSFTIHYNKYIYACVKHLFNKNIDKIDIATVLSAANEIGLENAFKDNQCREHLQSMFNCYVLESNVRKLAAKIRKFEIARLLQHQLRDTAHELNSINGDETFAQILGIAEQRIFDFSSLINDNESEPHRVSSDIDEYVEYLANNPVDQVGVPSGFPEWDKAIGGGLRPGTHVIGARLKCGKSMLGGNLGFHIANNSNIPVLNMDTELTREEHTNRFLAMASECFTYDIETGKFAKKPHTSKKVRETAKQLKDKKIPYFHKSIAGMAFEEQMAIMRRWVMKNVGLKGDGTAKPCVIVYDYLKLMSGDGLNKSLQEYQLLGFMMTGLQNFAIRYKIPILLFVQLNRDGIDDESTAATSGSDRIGWFCTSLTYFKKKSDEEIAEDPLDNGNRKLVVIEARHGPGREWGDYINCHFRGEIAKVVEGKRKLVLLQEKKNAKNDTEQNGDAGDTGF